jgi:hypothetical protein
VSAELAGAGLEDFAEDAAFAYARKFRLVCEDGTIVCSKCGTREALLPSLACGGCLGAYYASKHITLPHCLNRKQNEEDKVRARVGKR